MQDLAKREEIEIFTGLFLASLQECWVVSLSSSLLLCRKCFFPCKEFLRKKGAFFFLRNVLLYGSSSLPPVIRLLETTSLAATAVIPRILGSTWMTKLVGPCHKCAVEICVIAARRNERAALRHVDGVNKRNEIKELCIATWNVYRFLCCKSNNLC